MKVYCPIAECKWETTFPTKGMENHEIFAKGKSELINHKRKSKHCNRCYCACSKSFTTQHALDQHIRKYRHNTVEHFELTYVSVISNNNHRILNVETHKDEENVVNFSAFRDAKNVVFGSTIGANAYDAPPFAMPDYYAFTYVRDSYFKGLERCANI